jgi:aminopeptidase N
MEDKYGADSLKHNLSKDRNQVFEFEKKYSAPVVDSAFAGKKQIEMLNANAYQKGGWVLHMLRRKIGDEAFWRGIVSYYKQYNGGNANTDDLRTVMEKASGVDLKPFFKQWLRTAGHPTLNITHTYNQATKTITLKVEQQQEGLYQMALEYTVDGKLNRMNIKNKVTTVSVPVSSSQPILSFDPGVNLLASFNVE